MVKSYSDYRKDWDKKFDQIEQLANSYVLIGFQEGTVTKSQVKDGRKKKAGQSMAQIAFDNEYGNRKKNIPARPFMTTSFDENREQISRVIEGEYNKIIDNQSTLTKSLNLIGLYGVDLIQAKIRAIHTPPNSPTTIARKKSSKPLIDFGQMIQSVRSKIVIP